MRTKVPEQDYVEGISQNKMNSTLMGGSCWIYRNVPKLANLQTTV